MTCWRVHACPQGSARLVWGSQAALSLEPRGRHSQVTEDSRALSSAAFTQL